MNFSLAFLNTNLNDLTYGDIEAFFQVEREETINLEFKSYPTQGSHSDKEYSVLKAICGMLNSEGGIVIWGAPIEVRDINGNTTAQGDLTPFATRLDRDRLINKVSSLIMPLPIGIRLQQLIAPDGNSIFVFEVQKSVSKPHQYQNHYFIRLDGQTKIAPHYLIESMMKSIEFPVIRGHLRLKVVETDGSNYILSFRKVIYNTSMINELKLLVKTIGGPGTFIINGSTYSGIHQSSSEILSNGRPISDDFVLRVPIHELREHNYIVKIALNFVGQKSPSRTSLYEYSLANSSIPLGNVDDENIFLIKKEENKMANDVGTNNHDDIIDSILDY